MRDSASSGGLGTTRTERLRYEWLAALIFLLIALPITYLGRGEQSAYVRTFASFPNSQAGFGLFGYNYILDGAPIMAENPLYISQILMFNGSPDDVTFHFTTPRSIYAFLASLWAPLVGVIGSQILLNWLAWALAAYVTWRFTIVVFADRLAALLAVVLVSGGLGFAIHIHDYSPHLVPFTVYYLGLLVIYESGVWTTRRPLRIHLLLGTFLALACLTYTMELALALGYVVIALWRNRWWHVAVAAVIAFSSRLVYVAGLNAMHSYVSGNWQWTPIVTSESDYLGPSLAIWRTSLQDPMQFLNRVANGLAQFSLFEFPLIVVLGLLSWIMLPRSWAMWRFFVVFYVLPIAGGMAYLNNSTTRGYMVYGISLLLYAPLAAMLAAGLRSSRPRALAATALGLVVVISQLAWSTGHLWGYIVPAKMFFGFGSLDWMPLYLGQFHPAPAFSLTGVEPTPQMFGGGASLRDAGVFIAESAGPVVKYSTPVAILSRAVILSYAVLLAICATTSRRTRSISVAAAVLLLGVVPVVMPRFMPLSRPPVQSTFYSTVVPPNASLRYDVRLSEAFLAQLRRYERPDVSVQFVTSGIHAPFDVTVTDGHDAVLAESHQGGMLQTAKLTLPDVLDAVERSRALAVLYTTRDPGAGGQAGGTAVFGWQRNGLEGRRLVNARTDAPWDAAMLPALEMRLIDTAGRPVLVGF